jgi:chromosome segregation ATPase
MERNLAKELALLATEVDSLAKELALARAERASETKRRERAATDAAQLRVQLQHARERAKASERDLGRFSRQADADAHTAQAIERDLRLQLEAAQNRNEVLQHEVERIERERRVLERNQRELLGNLRQAAQEAWAPEGSSVATDDATLVPARPTDVGW